MITKDDYMQRVRANSKPRESEFDTIEFVMKLMEHCWDLEEGSKTAQNRRELYEEMSDTPMRVPGLAYFYDLGPEGADAIRDDRLMDSWVYDRVTGTIILNLDRGAHEAFCAKLYALYTGAPTFAASMKEMDRMAEMAVEHGLVFFLSSRATKYMRGAEVSLTAQEKRIFKDLPFRAI